MSSTNAPTPDVSVDAPRSQTRALRLTATYLVALAASEAVVVFVDASYGAACHAALITALAGAVVLLDVDPRSRSKDRAPSLVAALTVLALVSLGRILSLTMPVPDLPEIYWYAVTGAPLLLSLGLVARFLGRRWARDAFPMRWSLEQAAIGLSGAPLGLTAYLLVRPERIESQPSLRLAIVGTVILLVFNALIEEMLFRGALQRTMVDLVGDAGVVVSGAAFGLMYLGTRSPLYVAFMAVFGVALGWFVLVTRSLVGAVFAHALLSVGLLLVWPYVLG